MKTTSYIIIAILVLLLVAETAILYSISRGGRPYNEAFPEWFNEDGTVKTESYEVEPEYPGIHYTEQADTLWLDSSADTLVICTNGRPVVIK